MSNKKHLHILWTNADPITFQAMVAMYSKNSLLRGWWDEVTVIIWGATAKLTAENPIVQEELKLMAHTGVKISACIACARQLGVEDDIKKLDSELKAWGEPLTELLQNNEKVLSI